MNPSYWLAATGAGLCWACAPPTPLGALLLAVSSVAAAAAVQGRLWHDAFRGLWLGFLAHVGVLWWLPDTWSAFSGSGATMVWLGAALVQALPSAAALATAGWALGKRLPLPLAATLGWLLAATIGGFIQLVPTPVSLWLVTVPGLPVAAALAGIPLLDGLWAGWGALLLERPRHAIVSALLYGTVAGLWLAPHDRGVAQQVAIVQPGTGAFDGRRASTAPQRTNKLLRLLDEAGDAQWIATPENAWPTDPGDRAGARRRTFLSAFGQRPPTLLGATVRSGALRNRTLVVEEGEVRDHIDKHYLVPGAERAVLGFGDGQYSAGSPRRVVTIAETSVGVLTCYEALLPLAVSAAVWQGAEVLAAPTNDSWLGESKGSQLHLAGARLAAITSGRWLVRPTTSGTSAVIDPRGRLRWTAPWVDGDLHPSAPGYVHTATIRRRPSAWSGALISTPLSGLALLLLLVWARPQPSADP